MKTIIKTEKENKVLLDLVRRLMESDPEPNSREGQLLDLLAEQIQVFEKRYDLSTQSQKNE